MRWEVKSSGYCPKIERENEKKSRKLRQAEDEKITKEKICFQILSSLSSLICIFLQFISVLEEWGGEWTILAPLLTSLFFLHKGICQKQRKHFLIFNWLPLGRSLLGESFLFSLTARSCLWGGWLLAITTLYNNPHYTILEQSIIS